MIRIGLMLLWVAPLAGCGKTPNPLYALGETPAEAKVAEIGDRFDPNSTGRIVGRVLWTGKRPDEKSYRYTSLFPLEQSMREPLRNPLIPRIDHDGGMGDVLIYLRGVDPHRSKPWDHPQATIEMSDGNMRVVQGPALNSRFGVVPVGGKVELVSREPQTQLLRGREGDFFTLTLAEANRSRYRTFHRVGRVELSNASMQYWMRSWLYVADHPFYTRTNSKGEFELEAVPEGKYELGCATPNWHVERAERDPELMGFARIWYRPMIELVRPIEVRRGETSESEFRVSEEDFGKK